MAKTYIDVPVIGYQTWLITTGFWNEHGKFVDDEENDKLIDYLSKRYPYSQENNHVQR